jgi:hypothetical protein
MGLRLPNRRPNLTGFDLPCSLSIEFRWQTWLASGFDEDALKTLRGAE